METPESKFLSSEAVQKLLERLVEDARRDIEFLEKRIEQNEKKGRLTPVLQPKGAAKEEQKLLQHFLVDDKKKVRELKDATSAKADKFINLLPEELREKERQNFYSKMGLNDKRPKEEKELSLSESGKNAFNSLQGIKQDKPQKEFNQERPKSPFRSIFVKDEIKSQEVKKESSKVEPQKNKSSNLEKAFSGFESRFINPAEKEHKVIEKGKSKEGDKDER